MSNKQEDMIATITIKGQKGSDSLHICCDFSPCLNMHETTTTRSNFFESPFSMALLIMTITKKLASINGKVFENDMMQLLKKHDSHINREQ